MASRAAANAADERLDPRPEERVNALLMGAVDMRCRLGAWVMREAAKNACEAKSRSKRWNPNMLHATIETGGTQQKILSLNLWQIQKPAHVTGFCAAIRRLIGGNSAPLVGVEW